MPLCPELDPPLQIALASPIVILLRCTEVRQPQRIYVAISVKPKRDLAAETRLGPDDLGRLRPPAVPLLFSERLLEDI